MIIHHDISGELITLTVEALDRRHHQVALAGVTLLPTSSEPPGNKIGDLILPPVRKFSPVTKFHDLFAVARARTPAHRRQAGTPVPLISSHQTLMPPSALTVDKCANSRQRLKPLPEDFTISPHDDSASYAMEAMRAGSAQPPSGLLAGGGQLRHV